MARQYGRIAIQFWNNADMRGSSDRARLLAVYLLSCPNSNCIGAYLLPNAYVADDLGWSIEAVSKAFAELCAKAFCERFKDGRHVVICRFLAWNPIENPNVAKAAAKQLALLPDDPALQHVWRGLKAYREHFQDGFESLWERFRNMEPELETEPYTEPEIEPEPDSARSAVADEISQAVVFFNSIAKELDWPEAQILSEARRKKLAGRLRECGGLQGWQAAMEKARASSFLRGERGRDKAHENWTPDIDFFLQQSSFTKLMEGKYDDRVSRAEPTGFAAVLAGARAVLHQ